MRLSWGNSVDAQHAADESVGPRARRGTRTDRPALRWRSTALYRRYAARLATTSRVRSSTRPSTGGSGCPQLGAPVRPRRCRSREVRWRRRRLEQPPRGFAGEHPSSDAVVCAELVPGHRAGRSEEDLWLDQAGARRALAVPLRAKQRRARAPEDVISLLARAVREVEAAVERRRVTPAVRTKFQVVALLVREEHARVQGDADQQPDPPGRAAQAPGRDRDDPREDRRARPRAARAPRGGCRRLRRGQVAQAGHAEGGGIEPAPEETAPTEPAAASPGTERRVVPRSVASRQLANPFLAPDFSSARPSTVGPRRLAGWELLNPLLTSFERAESGAPACMALPAPAAVRVPGDRELMPHQAQLVAAAAAGHRTFLLADEPGLGKTAQALLAAEAANAYPLLVVVPSVVKTNWAREAGTVDAEPLDHRGPRQRRHRRRLRRHRRRQLRGARPPRRLVRRLRLPRHGRRRGALHQEQDAPNARSTSWTSPSASGPAPRAPC